MPSQLGIPRIRSFPWSGCKATDHQLSEVDHRSRLPSTHPAAKTGT